MRLASRCALLSTALLLGACCATNPPRQEHPSGAAAAPAPAAASEALGAPPAPSPPKFKIDCDPPFAHPGNTSAFDGECGNDGEPEAVDAQARASEYEAKNSLCGNASSLIEMSFADFKKLQSDLAPAGIAVGNQDASVPDRSVLRDMPLAHSRRVGEGEIVRLVGFATVKGSQSDEGVNCHETIEGMTDIHINVSPDGVDCDGVVVEIIPHRRPKHWTHGEASNLLDQTVVRVTGQLFLDSRHSVKRVSANKCATPMRMSLWEIHPVYAMDICKNGTLAGCKADDESVWVAFAQ